VIKKDVILALRYLKDVGQEKGSVEEEDKVVQRRESRLVLSLSTFAVRTLPLISPLCLFFSSMSTCH